MSTVLVTPVQARVNVPQASSDRTEVSTETRNRSPDERTREKRNIVGTVILVIVAFAIAFVAGKIIIPKIVEFITTTAGTTATVVDAVSTTVKTAGTTVVKATEAANAVMGTAQAVADTVTTVANQVTTVVNTTKRLLTEPVVKLVFEKVTDFLVEDVGGGVGFYAPGAVQKSRNLFKLFTLL